MLRFVFVQKVYFSIFSTHYGDASKIGFGLSLSFSPIQEMVNRTKK